MAVDFVLFDKLVELSRRWRPDGRTLALGRQEFSIESQFRKLYEESLHRHGVDGNRFDFLQDDGFFETLMRKLGFGEIESLDFSDYQGASIVHDLNQPIPEDLEGQFDFVFDGGTLEHVFNIPVAFENVFRMLKPGGRLVSANGLNGWPGHGLYQFSPELVWTYWRRTANCNVLNCSGLTRAPIEGVIEELPFADPAEAGHRLRLRGRVPNERVYLYFEVERTPQSALASRTLQSDYEVRWSGHDNAEELSLSEAQI